MRLNPKYSPVRWGFGLAGTLLPVAFISGCASAWWNGFLDPTQVGNFRENVVTEIQDTVSFEDKPSGIPNAVDPTPDDLVATVENYQLGPGDVFQITLLDFMARGAQSEFVLTVDDLGYVDIAQIGRIRVEGLTLPEVRDEVARQAKARGIYAEESEPTITVIMGDQQNRTFSITGAVQAPGTYRIPRPDFRLTEALIMAGGSDEMLQRLYAGGRVRTIYVIRNERRPKTVKESVVKGKPSRDETNLKPADTGLPSAVVPEPAVPEPQSVQPSTRPGTQGPALPTDSVEQDLIDAVAPEGASPRRGELPSSAPQSKNESPPPLRPFIFVNDKLIEAPAGQEARRAATSASTVVETVPQTEQATRPVDWSELAGEGQQRIIRISAEALRTGDSSSNIVIRHQDLIRVDPGPIGTYYVGGHVVMPGQYPLNGEQVTLAQAVIAARGLDPLAWPTRCEIRRRIDRDREQITQWDLARIMAGQDPDVFLRPNDVVNVGTHAIAPFLYTIRNAFRFSYGFSFSYDRNWAEYDTLAGQYYRARTEASRRGLLSAFDF
ncbi:MAG TPA: polysaccharide biosynthesis/export family protein [Phycisphaerae bacterium]|nr:polysaccharide biosynthesis/export family protein [Phycisphaerae bacterium]HRR86854.1 polysaccharide biosynthesis/export family protein [Phycisphaerae bacterium]